MGAAKAEGAASLPAKASVKAAAEATADFPPRPARWALPRPAEFSSRAAAEAIIAVTSPEASTMGATKAEGAVSLPANASVRTAAEATADLPPKACTMRAAEAEVDPNPPYSH